MQGPAAFELLVNCRSYWLLGLVVERQSRKLKAAGSSPAGACYVFFFFLSSPLLVLYPRLRRVEGVCFGAYPKAEAKCLLKREQNKGTTL